MRVAAVLVALWLLAACGADPYYRGELATDERVPATPRSIAAAMLDHLEDEQVQAVGGVEEALTEVGPEDDAEAGAGRIVIATVGLADTELSVSVAPEDPSVRGAALCAELAEHCRDAVATDDEGNETPYQVLWQPGERLGSERGTAGMVLLRGESRVSVTLFGTTIPRAVDWTTLPVSRKVLESILLDPAISLETIPELVADGEEIADFQDRAFGL